MCDEWFSNRDRARDAERARMKQSGAGLKKIEAFKSSRKRVRRRGGVREPSRAEVARHAGSQ